MSSMNFWHAMNKGLCALIHLAAVVYCCCGAAQVLHTQLELQWYRVILIAWAGGINLMFGLRRIVELVRGVMGLDLYDYGDL